MIHQIMNRRLAVVSGLVILNAFGLATVARAGEGGIAGSAAFTVVTTGTTSNVTGVAVSAAVGKEAAAAHAFNFVPGGATTLQNSAFAMGSAGIMNVSNLGSSGGTTAIVLTEDTNRDVAQRNSFTTPFIIQIGTGDGSRVVETILPATPVAP